jgi:hypothetical protein
MKKICLLNLLFLLTLFSSSAQDKMVETEINKATFDYFEYKGNDAFFKKNINYLFTRQKETHVTDSAIRLLM